MRNNHVAQPFLKWAGGKGQLLDQYEAFFPIRRGGSYFEPFAGSGAVFFRLRTRDLFDSFRLSDVNEELINCYRAVRDQVDTLVIRLSEHEARHSHDYYYEVRALDRDPTWHQAPDVERAARMIYLNKTCYNGLWRVNSKGHFNVPMGRYRNPVILNEDRLRLASQALQNVALAVERFDAVVEHAGPGDFVYFDPPYHPLSDTANFTSYSIHAFGPDDQRRLAQVYADLTVKGCCSMLSNSDTPFIRALYGDYRIETVQARRAINSARQRRGPVSELVILNRQP